MKGLSGLSPQGAWVVLLATTMLSCHTSASSGVMLSIASDVALTRLAFSVRDIDYNVAPVVYYDLAGRDLVHQPLQLLIEPSATIKGRFFVHVKGFAGDQYVAMDGRILQFQPGHQVSAKVSLSAHFVDSDDDGFPLCDQGSLCDCNDTNGHVNPFTVEDCTDDLDNDCSGPPINAGCPCTDGAEEACTNLPASELTLAGVGLCSFGTLACHGGVLETACVAGVPGVEIPNNFLDDNCNGSVDEGSACSLGAQRACHLGFVDDPNNPDSTQRDASSQRSLGVCGDANQHPLGVQSCLMQGQVAAWGPCVGDVLPQRNVRPGHTGWGEIPPDTAHHSVGQCDGLDNDCDGLIDNAPEFDADRDHYKICGTDANATLLPALNSDLVDCNDANPAINPSAAEVCGNSIDEDCRCDHDPQGRAATEPNSVIGKPSVLPDGTAQCPIDDQALHCDVLPRSDGHATGLCKDGPHMYYGGFSATGDCFPCGLQYGVTCDTTQGSCAAKSQACAACTVPITGAPAAARPLCRMPISGSCRGSTAPSWQDINNLDPYNECPGVSCAGYYARVGERCFTKQNATDAQVFCQNGGACQGPAVACVNTAPQTTMPVAQPLCNWIASGCNGSQAPVFAGRADGADPFNECTSSFTCSDSEAGVGPFYTQLHGTCYYSADVAKNTCGFGTGRCLTRTEACNLSPAGKVAVGTRPPCKTIDGCVNSQGPQYSLEAAGEDLYGDCPASTCDGAGHCTK